MSTTECKGRIDEELLTGLLDGMLSQGERQRVRIHLEGCTSCRTLLSEMQAMRNATATTPFRAPADDQWDESPRSGLSRILRDAGLVIVALWLVASLALVFVGPEEESWDTLYRWLFAGSLVGWASLLGSVLIDRLQILPSDLYRGVKR